MKINITCEQCKRGFSYNLMPSQRSRKHFCRICANQRKKISSMCIDHKDINKAKDDGPNMKIVFGYDEVSVLL